MRPVLKPVTQTSDMEGKDTAMWWTVRRAGDVGHRHTIHVCYAMMLQRIPGWFQHSFHIQYLMLIYSESDEYYGHI